MAEECLKLLRKMWLCKGPSCNINLIERQWDDYTTTLW